MQQCRMIHTALNTEDNSTLASQRAEENRRLTEAPPDTKAEHDSIILYKYIQTLVNPWLPGLPPSARRWVWKTFLFFPSLQSILPSVSCDVRKYSVQQNAKDTYPQSLVLEALGGVTCRTRTAFPGSAAVEGLDRFRALDDSCVRTMVPDRLDGACLPGTGQVRPRIGGLATKY